MNEELKSELRSEVVTLINKANKAINGVEAMQLSQAALNAANAFITLENVDKGSSYNVK